MSASLCVERSGAAALPLVCLHGWGMNLRVFDPLRQALGGESWALDLPGHGRSAWNPARADFDAQLEDLVKVLPPRSVLLGWSLGAQFAMQIALQYPGRVAGLVRISATPRFERAPDWPHGLDAAALEMFRETLTQDWGQTLEDFIWLQLRGSRHAESAQRQINEALQAHGSPESAALSAGLSILAERDMRRVITSLAVPVLVLAGQNDRVTPPAAGQWLSTTLSQGRYHEIPRAGHAPFLSHVEESALPIRAFVDELLAVRR